MNGWGILYYGWDFPSEIYDGTFLNGLKDGYGKYVLKQ